MALYKAISSALTDLCCVPAAAKMEKMAAQSCNIQ
jgi:hypothetical protein